MINARQDKIYIYVSLDVTADYLQGTASQPQQKSKVTTDGHSKRSVRILQIVCSCWKQYYCCFKEPFLLEVFKYTLYCAELHAIIWSLFLVSPRPQSRKDRWLQGMSRRTSLCLAKWVHFIFLCHGPGCKTNFHSPAHSLVRLA